MNNNQFNKSDKDQTITDAPGVISNVVVKSKKSAAKNIITVSLCVLALTVAALLVVLPNMDSAEFTGMTVDSDGGSVVVTDTNQEKSDSVPVESLSEETNSEAVESLLKETDSEPINSEPINSEPVNSEPVNSEPINSEPMNSEQVNSEQVNSEQVNSEPINSEPINSEPITLNLAEIYAAEYPASLSDLEFARLVEERTEGRIKVEVFFSGFLGTEEEALQQLVSGETGFARASSSPLSPLTAFNQDLNALTLPYIFDNEDHFWRVLNGEVGQSLLKGAEDDGLVGLAWYDSGARHFYSSKPLKDADSFERLKIRAQYNPVMQDIVNSLGGIPVTMSVGEIFPALHSATIDASENIIPTYESMSHYEAAPYLLLTGHVRTPDMLLASKSVMDKLTPTDQEIIQQAAKEVQVYQIRKWKEREDEALSRIANHITVTEISSEQRRQFADATAIVITEQGKGLEELIERIRNS